MNKNHLEELIDLSIRLEQNVASLYALFSELAPEDKVFWGQLHLEEKSHANLIRAAKDSFIKRGDFPYELVGDSIGELKISTVRIMELIDQYKVNPPSRREACEMAIVLENDVGELHYAYFMGKSANNRVESVFQQLNKEDKDHELRIADHLARLPAEV